MRFDPRCPVSRRKALKRKVASANEPKGNHSNNKYLLSTSSTPSSFRRGKLCFKPFVLCQTATSRRCRSSSQKILQAIFFGSPVFFALKEDGGALGDPALSCFTPQGVKKESGECQRAER